MQLVIKGGKVRAVYDDEVDIVGKYDLNVYEVVDWDGEGKVTPDGEDTEMPDDPRTPAQKVEDASLNYMVRRRRAYPTIRRMLRMIYRDMRDGTSVYVDAITAVNDQFPPPE